MDYYTSSDNGFGTQGTTPFVTTTKTTEKGASCSCCDFSSRSYQAYIVILINVFFLLAGILLVFIGSWSIANQDYYGNFLAGATFGFVTWSIIFVGLLVIFVSLFGIYAAFKESKLLLKIYVGFVGTLMLMEVVVVTVALVYRGKIYSSVESSFNATIVHQYGFKSQVTKALDSLHRDQECCGVNYYVDWKYSKWVQDQNKGKDEDDVLVHAPDTCCKTETENCGVLAHPNNLYDHGCLKRVTDFFARNLLALSMVALSVMLLQVLALVVSILLLNRVRKQIVWEWY